MQAEGAIMDLAEYLVYSTYSVKDMSDILEVAYLTMWRIVKRRQNPSLQLAHRISDFTKGMVPVHAVRNCTHNCPKGCACSQGEKDD